ncbi:unnamed protein product, partial [Phaeothamnion confervicola]
RKEKGGVRRRHRRRRRRCRHRCCCFYNRVVAAAAAVSGRRPPQREQDGERSCRRRRRRQRFPGSKKHSERGGPRSDARRSDAPINRWRWGISRRSGLQHLRCSFHGSWRRRGRRRGISAHFPNTAGPAPPQGLGVWIG